MIAALLLAFLANTVFSGTVVVPTDKGRVDIPLTAQMEGLGGSTALFNVTANGDALEAALRDAVAEGTESLLPGCNQDLVAREPIVRQSGGRLEANVSVTYTQYMCSDFFGKQRVFTESGMITASLVPSVEDGRPRFDLGTFTVTGLSRVAQALQVEAVLRAAIEAELRKIERDEDMKKTLDYVSAEGFTLTDLRFGADEGAFRLHAAFEGPADRERFRSTLKTAAAQSF